MGILNKKIFSRCENTCVKMKRKKKKPCYVLFTGQVTIYIKLII